MGLGCNARIQVFPALQTGCKKGVWGLQMFRAWRLGSRSGLWSFYSPPLGLRAPSTEDCLHYIIMKSYLRLGAPNNQHHVHRRIPFFAHASAAAQLAVRVVFEDTHRSPGCLIEKKARRPLKTKPEP